MTKISALLDDSPLTGKRLAIIGVGMMGGALAQGLVRAQAMEPDCIWLYDAHPARVKLTAEAIALPSPPHIADSAAHAISECDIVLLAVKPYVVTELLTEIAPALNSLQLLISIAAGIKTATMESVVPEAIPVVRVMPNTPSLVGEGAAAIAKGKHATQQHMLIVETLFAAVGKTVIVDERLMDAVTGLSGSGPAYVYLLIEALMDGGVKAGLTRETARLLAAQTVYGAAKMVLESTEHPAQLKDNVTTPGGTTIQALAVLERAGFRTAVIDAIEAAAQRSRELS